MDRDDRDVTGFAMPAENVVHRRIIDSGVDKDGLIFGKVLYQFRKLNDGLPVNLNFIAVLDKLGTPVDSSFFFQSMF